MQSKFVSVHVPSEPATLHLLQLPSQVVAQQTPLIQWAESQSPSKVQVAAKAFFIPLRFVQTPDAYICTVLSVVLNTIRPSAKDRAFLCVVV